MFLQPPTRGRSRINSVVNKEKLAKTKTERLQIQDFKNTFFFSPPRRPAEAEKQICSFIPSRLALRFHYPKSKY